MPLGVYDHRPPEDVEQIKAVSVGNNFPARLAAEGQKVSDRINNYLERLIPFGDG